MRKLIVLLISIALSAVLLAACGELDEAKLIRNSVSDITEDVLSGSGENFEAEIVIGSREAPYALDGVRGEMGKIFQIKVVPKTACTEESLEYSFTAGKDGSSGVLPKSRYRSYYTTDLKRGFAEVGKSLTLTVKWGDKSEEIPLASVIKDNMLGAQAALDKVIAAKKEMLSGMFENKDFKGEICVRLINDKAAEGKKYFWYVAIVKDKSDMNSLLLDAETGEFLAERTA